MSRTDVYEIQKWQRCQELAEENGDPLLRCQVERLSDTDAGVVTLCEKTGVIGMDTTKEIHRRWLCATCHGAGCPKCKFHGEFRAYLTHEFEPGTNLWHSVCDNFDSLHEDSLPYYGQDEAIW